MPVNKTPLVVDLDGTLIKTDLLVEAANLFLCRQFYRFLLALVWLLQGKAIFKKHLAEEVQLDIAYLPYNEALIAWLRGERAQGRKIVLATAAHRSVAVQVAEYLELFDEVLATDNNVNLKSVKKRDRLVERYGHEGFDYVGDAWADLAVWKSSARAYVMSDSQHLTARVKKNHHFAFTFSSGVSRPGRALLKALRMHQWVKNLLVFVPLLTAHQYTSATNTAEALLAFVAFGMIASSGYVLNDLVDVFDDRRHPYKKYRPFASGDLSLTFGWLLWPSLALSALAFSIAVLPWTFACALAAYFLLALAYSFWLKQQAVIDVITLAGLYTLRIFAGALAINVPLSFWLAAFSVFIFISLALMKRFSELKLARHNGYTGQLHGRGYYPEDLEMVAGLGGGAGYIAVLILALYIQEGATAYMYHAPKLLWLTCPILLYWISRVWLIAHRGQMHDDPIVFALKDCISWIVGTMFLTTFILAKLL